MIVERRRSRDVRVHRRACASMRRGPRVVFVHGAANDHGVWALQSRYFAHHGFNALAVDLPGHGRSAGPAQASVEALADWLVALRRRCRRRARRAGRPFAGRAGGARGRGARAAKVSHARAARPRGSDGRERRLLAAARADDHVAFELIIGWSSSAGEAARRQSAARRLDDRQRDAADGAHAAGRAACRPRGMPRVCGRARGRGAQLRCPGAADPRCARLHGAAAQPRRRSPTRCADAHVVTLPDCGHAMMAEQPDAVLDALIAFFGSGRRG